MQVFKFGGASLKDAEAISRMADIVENFGSAPLVIVVSALGKTTRALEELYTIAVEKNDYTKALEELRNFHLDVAEKLVPGGSLTKELEGHLTQLEGLLSSGMSDGFAEYYDQIVSRGEIMSSIIVHGLLRSRGLPIELVNAAEVIRTDDNFREGKVQWDSTVDSIRDRLFGKKDLMAITQGFIGSTKDGKYITLGKEGSDFTAAIMGYSLDAERIVVWKDVPGILSADPKFFPDCELFNELSYAVASEMTYYGASVIHPKTIRPLAVKRIPLYVRSFKNPAGPGTCIHDCKVENVIPTIITKSNQCVISFKLPEFTFVNEQYLHEIMGALSERNIKLNLLQNSAISVSICVDYNERRVRDLINTLSEEFEITFNYDLLLITVINPDDSLVEELVAGREIMMEQRLRRTVRIIVPNNHEMS